MKSRSTIYRGERIRNWEGQPVDVWVTVDELPLTLPPSLKVWNHSPTGFNWGYGGSGPAQLALALLLDALGNRDWASRLHQQFKRATVETFGDSWEMTAGEILDWVERYLEASEADTVDIEPSRSSSPVPDPLPAADQGDRSADPGQ